MHVRFCQSTNLSSKVDVIFYTAIHIFPVVNGVLFVQKWENIGLSLIELGLVSGLVLAVNVCCSGVSVTIRQYKWLIVANMPVL